ncbi:MAG: hypothetical protein KC478_12055 [Bacteriovoracaceae bacterium]|nr:hypothetical protein [Bacteriovoracaceae bacterium]
MKQIITFFLLVAGISAFANKPAYLDKYEQHKAANYLSFICMDTYCGGDINWRGQSIECDSKECVLSMNATSYYADSPVMSIETFKNANNLDKETHSAKLVEIDTETEETYNDKGEAEFYTTTKLYTECTLDLPYANSNVTYDQKEKLVYFAALNCVDQLQEMIWKINSQN